MSATYSVYIRKLAPIIYIDESGFSKDIAKIYYFDDKKTGTPKLAISSDN